MAVEINYLGLGCFRLVKRGFALLIDPYLPQAKMQLTKQKAEVVVISDPAVRFDKKAPYPKEAAVFCAAGEYEVGGVSIEGIELKNPEAEDERQLGFLIELEGVSYFHTGALSFVPSEIQLDKLTSVEVLFVPVGSGAVLDPKQAKKMIDMIEPSLVIPMLAQDKKSSTKEAGTSIDDFLAICNGTAVDKVETLKISISTIGDETRICVIDRKE